MFSMESDIRLLPVLNERTGFGFKILYPNERSLRMLINPNPRTKEEALKNREIFEQMKALGVKDE